jgi:hypothetical protein
MASFDGLENLIIPESGNDGYFVVGLADVLGQSDKLLAYNDPPPQGLANREKLAALRSDTLVPVRRFRKDFHDQFRSYEKAIAKSPLNCISGPVGALLDSIDSEPVGVHVFSDLVALSLSLGSKSKAVPMKGVFLMTAAFGMASLCSLYRGHPIRGGIELDVAWLIRRHEIQSEIYGPALAKAYHLESSVAGYPRIVVGENFLRYNAWWALLPDSGDIFQNANREYAHYVSNLLVTDDDGKTVVNPFAVVNLFGDWTDEGKKQHRQVADRCLAFSDGERKKFEACGDAKLMARYSRLISFIQKHGGDANVEIA